MNIENFGMSSSRSIVHHLGVHLFAVIVSLGAWTGSMKAQDLMEEEQVAIKQAAAYASPSVVQIETFAGLDANDNRQAATNLSTGTVLTDDGVIVASLYALRNKPASITVVLPGGARLAAKILSRDRNRQLVVLKIEPPQPLIPIEVSPSNQWRIGQWVVGLGKTFSPEICSQTSGILSATGRIFDKAIQSDAKISPQNYGGPLIDLQGKALGIITPLDPGIATEGEVEQWYDSGIGFAVPAQDVMERLPLYRQGNDVYPGRLGIRPNAPDDFGGPVTLAGVTPGSPAAKAGLRGGDELLQINGKPVPRLNALRHALGPLDAGNDVVIEFKRDGKIDRVQTTLVQEVPPYREPFLGFFAKQGADDKSISVEAIVAGSPAEKAGLKPGMTILSIGDKLVDSIDTLAKHVAFQDYREPMSLKVRLVKEGANSEEAITLQATPWSSTLPKELPVLQSRSEESGEGTGIVELALGDVPNKAFAYVPRNYDRATSHGLVIALADAGPVDRKAWVDAWEPFCRQHRWILVVLGSASEKQWSIDEAELIPRLRTTCIKDYAIDPRRIVLGGHGSGGTLSFLVALRDRAKVRGVWVAESRVPPMIRLPEVEPLESLQIFLAGAREEYAPFSEITNKTGYTVIRQNQAIDLKTQSQGEYLSALHVWLRRLESF